MASSSPADKKDTDTEGSKGLGKIDDTESSQLEDSKEPEPVEDPWALDETTPATAEGETFAPSSERSEALSHLRDSSSKLITNLDSRIGLSGAFGALGQSVKTLDEKTHVSETVKSATGTIGGTLGSWFSSVDEKLNISSKTKELGSSIKQLVPTQEISEGFQKSTRALQSFDESHGITRSAANTLASGADFLTNTITIESEENYDDTLQDDLDQDGIPSSFQRDE